MAIEDLLRIESVTLFAFYMGMTASIFSVMHTTNPQPYMDEIFHIPQAQKYCNGTFDSWDPKITTLPGLYLFSSGILGNETETQPPRNARPFYTSERPLMKCWLWFEVGYHRNLDFLALLFFPTRIKKNWKRMSYW